MIRNTNYPLREMSFDSAIWGSFDLIFDTFVSADDDGRRSEPSVSVLFTQTRVPLSYCSDRDAEAFLGIRDVSNIRGFETTRSTHKTGSYPTKLMEDRETE